MLACDRWGARPIYYTRTRGRVPFASEYKALLAIADVPARWNPEAVLYSVRTHNANPRLAFLAGVDVVPRGSWVTLGGTRRDGALLRHRRRSRAAPGGGARGRCAFRAVRRIAPADGAARRHRSRPERGARFGARACGYPPRGSRESRCTRSPWVMATRIARSSARAKRRATSRHSTTRSSSAQSTCPPCCPEAIWHMEDPVGGEEMIYAFIAAKEASQYVDTVFSGEKSDALFAGMPRHRLVELAASLPPFRGVLEEFYHYTQSRRMPRSIAARRLVDFLLPARPAVRDFRARQPRLATAASVAVRLGPAHFGKASPGHAGRFLDAGRDGAAACSARSPLELAVHRIPGWSAPAFQIEDALKIRGRQQKYILRRACEGLAPDSVLKRKKSLQRLRNDMRLTDVLDRLATDLLSPGAVAARGMFEPVEVARICNRRSEGFPIRGNRPSASGAC